MNISIVSDRNDKDIIRQIKSSGATEMAVSPDGKEVAFVLRGDVYVTSVEYKTTKQITNTPCQERTVDFAPMGGHWFMLPNVAGFGNFTLRRLCVRMKSCLPMPQR